MTAAQRQACAQAECAAARHNAEVAGARGATLQRAKQTHRMRQLFAHEEDLEGDLELGNDDSFAADALHDDQDVTGGSRGQQRQPSGLHALRRLLYEQRFQVATKKAVQYCTLQAPQLAALERELMEEPFAILQRHVSTYSGSPTHLGCAHPPDSISISGWRSVLIQGMAGVGSIEIPIFRCATPAWRAWSGTVGACNLWLPAGIALELMCALA